MDERPPAKGVDAVLVAKPETSRDCVEISLRWVWHQEPAGDCGKTVYGHRNAAYSGSKMALRKTVTSQEGSGRRTTGHPSTSSASAGCGKESMSRKTGERAAKMPRKTRK